MIRRRRRELLKWQGMLIFAMVFLQGCCLIFECPCNYRHRIRNCSGETLECRIVSAERERNVLLAPGETVRLKDCSELFLLREGEYDAAFPSILGGGLFCPLEITPEKTLFVTESSFYEHIQSPYLRPVYIPHKKRLFWSDLIDETMENIQSFQRQLKEWRDPTTGNVWKYRLVGGKAILESKSPLGSSRYKQKVTLPAFVGDVPVCAIGRSVFSETKLGAVIIPNGVEGIGKNAFEWCSVLEQVTLPEGLIRIEERAFGSCHELKTLRFPATVKVIGASAFEWCSELTGIRLPKSVSFLGWHAFGHCAQLQTIRFDGPPPAGEGDIVTPSDEVIGIYPDEYAVAWESAMVDGYWRGLRMTKRAQGL